MMHCVVSTKAAQRRARMRHTEGNKNRFSDPRSKFDMSLSMILMICTGHWNDDFSSYVLGFHRKCIFTIVHGRIEKRDNI